MEADQKNAVLFAELIGAAELYGRADDTTAFEIIAHNAARVSRRPRSPAARGSIKTHRLQGDAARRERRCGRRRGGRHAGRGVGFSRRPGRPGARRRLPLRPGDRGERRRVRRHGEPGRAPDRAGGKGPDPVRGRDRRVAGAALPAPDAPPLRRAAQGPQRGSRALRDGVARGPGADHVPGARRGYAVARQAQAQVPRQEDGAAQQPRRCSPSGAPRAAGWW